MKFLFSKSQPVIVEAVKLETFSNGLLVECRFKNGWPCPKCVKPDTFIVGDNLQISEITNENKCIGITGIENVQNTMSRLYSGKLIQIRACGLLPIEVTPEHPLLGCYSTPPKRNHSHVGTLSEPKWILANQLKSKVTFFPGDYLAIPRLKGIFNDTCVKLTTYTTIFGAKVATAKKVPLDYPLTTDNAWLLGLYIAEGVTSPKAVIFCLGKHETNLQNEVIRITRNLGYLPCLRQVKTATIIEVSSRLLSRAFTHLCGKGASRKQIPEILLFHKDLSLLQSLLDGYKAGDGYIDKQNRRFTMNTVSKVLALQSQLAYARLGIFARVTVQSRKTLGTIQGRTVHLKTKYGIFIDETYDLHHIHAHLTDDFLFTPIRHIVEIDYNGYVFNLTTPDHSYLVSNAVVHNCGEITEHVQIDNREVCQRKSSSGRVCGEPVKGGISVDRFNGYVHSSQDWLIQRIKGIDYSETFGRDRTTGLVMFHRCCYRKLHFRELSDCGVWVDGEKVYGYTDMEKQGLLKKRLL